MTFTPEYLRSLGIDPTGLHFHNDTMPYDPSLVTAAKQMRVDGTRGEAFLWKILKNKQTGYKFTRQKPILHYIVDFYCHELKLVVEVDGESHNDSEKYQYDRHRDAELKALGLCVVRLLDGFVKSQPVPAAQSIFQRAGIPMPPSLDYMSTGQERLWPSGLVKKSRVM